MDYEKTGRLIQELRKEKEMTQMSLADKLGVTDRAVSKWERGKSFPDVSMLRPLARYRSESRWCYACRIGERRCTRRVGEIQRFVQPAQPR